MKLGFLDSGVGGWSVLRKCLASSKKLASQNQLEEIIYLGDFANVPYGNKDLKELAEILEKNLLWFAEREVNFLVLACNTSSSLINQALRNKFSKLKIIDLVSETNKYLKNNFELERLKKSKLLIFSTQATHDLGLYQRNLSEFFESVDSIPSRELAGLIEEYLSEPRKLHKLSFDLIKQYQKLYLRQKIDFLLLGCTHYPILSEVFQELFPEALLIDPADAIRETLQQEFLVNFEAFDFELVEFSSTDPKIDLKARIKELSSNQ